MLDPLVVRANGPKQSTAQAAPFAKVLVDRIAALPAARWTSVRAQLDQLVAHPEARDDLLAELDILLHA